MVMIDRFKSFHDSMESGAWPLLVGGMICLVNSDNERERRMINRLLHWVSMRERLFMGNT